MSFYLSRKNKSKKQNAQPANSANNDTNLAKASQKTTAGGEAAAGVEHLETGPSLTVPQSAGQQGHPQGHPQLGQTPQGQTPQGQAEGQTPQDRAQSQTPQGQTLQGQTPQGHTPQDQTPQGEVQGQTPQDQTPQGQAQGQTPQGQAQGQTPQGQAQGQTPQGQTPQGQAQGQTPQAQLEQGQTPQGQAQGQTPQAQGQTPQALLEQGQTPQGQAQGQTPQAQLQQGQTPQGQAQGQTPQAQGQTPRGQTTQGQAQGQTPQGETQGQTPQGHPQQGQTQDQSAGGGGVAEPTVELAEKRATGEEEGVTVTSRGPAQTPGPRDRRVLRRIGGWLEQHGVIIMTQMTLTFLSCLLAAWGTLRMVERPYSSSEDTLVQKVVDRVVSNESLIGDAVLGKYLNTTNTTERLSDTLMPRLQGKVKNFTRYNFEYKCLHTEQEVWKIYEDELKKAEENLRKEYEKKLHAKMEDFKTGYIQKLATMKSDFEDKVAAAKTNFNIELGIKEEALKKHTAQRIGEETGGLREKMDEIMNTLGIRDKLLEIQGFLKIDSIGPVLLLMGVVEAFLTLCIIVLFGRSFGRAAAGAPPPPLQQQQQQQRGVNAANLTNSHNRGGGGDAAIQQPPSRPPISTNNSNLACLCFRDADENLSRRLGSKLLESCRGRNIRLKIFVVNCMDDIQSIPACRAALVFVDPDEREMIVEDERFHIGQGLRKNAIKRLLDSGVEVFIIIFNDKMSVTLDPSQLYNSKLGQVDQHQQLKLLKSQGRVFSVKDQIHQHQTSLIVKELNSVFG